MYDIGIKLTAASIGEMMRCRYLFTSANEKLNSPSCVFTGHNCTMSTSAPMFCSSNVCSAVRQPKTANYLFGEFCPQNNFRLFKRNLSIDSSEMGDLKRDFVKITEAKRFMVDCLVASKTPKNHAEMMADLLVAADYRGHFSHGMNRLEMYLNDLHSGTTDGAAEPEVLKESPATAWVNGKNGLGAVVGHFCMDLAIKKAKTVGVGWVCANHSNHYGIAGWYAIQAQTQGLIGMSMTNTSPVMCPTRAKIAALGTNPLSLAAPGENGDGMVLDMATTSVAIGKIELQKRKKMPIPSGWALDKTGSITTDAEEAFSTSLLLPLGGMELTSGYKGYGLSALVETLTGISANANFSTKVRKWSLDGSSHDEANLGQVFIAVDPNCFAPGFEHRMTEMNGILRNLPSIDEEKPVLVPGDPEKAHMKQVDEEGGITYHANQLKNCDELAARFNIPKLGSL